MKTDPLKSIQILGKRKALSGALSAPAAAGLVVLIGVGFFLGSLLPKSASDEPAAATNPPAERPAPRAAEASPTPVTLRSTDTIEDLLAAEPETLYERLALWLVDATSDEMAAYLQATKGVRILPNKTDELLFLRWTLIDPHAALAAAKGHAWTSLAWTAWARNDPLKALEAARERGVYVLKEVIECICQVDPQLAQTILKEHPDLAQHARMDMILGSLSLTDPEAAMELAAAQLSAVGTGSMKKWFLHDPHATLAWLLAHGKDLSVYLDIDKQADCLRDALQGGETQLIRELAAQCPPGKFRQELDEMIFDRKLKEDPDAALAEARANPSPMVAVRQLVKIAGHEIRNNPEKSLTLLDEILRGPHLVDERIFNEKGYSSDPRVVPGLVGVVQELTLKQPETVMKCLQKHGLVNPTSNLFSNARVAWFWHDPEAASRWFDANGFPKK